LPDLMATERAVNHTLAKGIRPRCMELLDDQTLQLVRPHLSMTIDERVNAMLLVELDGEEKKLEEELESCGQAMTEVGAMDILVAQHSGERERLWSARRELSRALRETANFKLAEDVVVPRSRITDLIKECQLISNKYSIRMPCYGHAGDGNIHVNFLWDDPAQRKDVVQGIEALFRAVVQMKGSISGEHGIGVLKAPYLKLEQSAELIELQKQLKTLFDPNNILNPGKIFDR